MGEPLRHDIDTWLIQRIIEEFPLHICLHSDVTDQSQAGCKSGRFYCPYMEHIAAILGIMISHKTLWLAKTQTNACVDVRYADIVQVHVQVKVTCMRTHTRNSMTHRQKPPEMCTLWHNAYRWRIFIMHMNADIETNHTTTKICAISTAVIT